MDSSAPDRQPTSLYRRIVADIGGRILSGEWPPGHRVPFEHELTAAYGCSRMTVNKAMGELVKAGLIERRRRAGSVVALPRSQSAVLEIHDIRVEVQALGLPYRYELLDRVRRRATKSDAAFPGGAPLLALTCRHFAGDRPFCLEERVIGLDTVPEAADADFSATAPGPWLLAQVPWSAAEHTIGAVEADAKAAGALSIARGTACLVVERRTWTGGEPVTAVRLTYPGATHALVARFTPQGG